MNIALKKIDSAASASRCVPGSFGTLVLGAVLLGAMAGPALAAPGDPYGQRRDDQPNAQQQPRDGQRYDNGRREPRAAYEARDDQRPQAQEQNRDAGRRGGRLTADERRDLRRQINQAGQDIYARPPRP
ncbi:MAG: hypothetical protein V4754_10835 [Pseudomonadota bacterium]